jgi:hypothetical protein
MTSEPFVFVVILNWNRPLETLACVDAVRQSHYLNYGMVIVDNASSDNSVARIRSSLSNIPLIQNDENLGYAGGNNVGIRYALSHGADYVLVLNNDAFPEPDALGYLVAAMKPGVAAVGGKVYLYGERQRLWAAGKCFARGVYPYDEGQFDQPDTVSYAVGCCLLLSVDALQEIGLFDEAFFLVHEEKEWCWRARQAGYTIAYQPKAVTYHKNASSFTNTWSPMYHYLFTRNELLLWEKQDIISGGLRSLKGIYFVARAQVQLTLHGQRRLARTWAVVRGVVDYFRGHFGPPPAQLGGNNE